ncbi:MAG: methylmalonyl-CoA epimerase [Acidimicrobiia bacterium]|nr:methylmalonyl-CoA epimerase [Acidimicrobiia bacterium]
MLINLDHVGIAVENLNESLATFKELYGVEPMHRETVASQGVEEAMLSVGGSYVQLLQPIDEDGPVARFLRQRGQGMHHLAFAVADIEAALRHLESQGARLVDVEPRIGGQGKRIAFVHPRSFGGTLIELVESP